MAKKGSTRKQIGSPSFKFARRRATQSKRYFVLFYNQMDKIEEFRLFLNFFSEPEFDPKDLSAFYLSVPLHQGLKGQYKDGEYF